MKLQELANLIMVRNHLELLINTDRAVVTKDKVNDINARKSAFDRVIVQGALELDLSSYESEKLQEKTATPMTYEDNGAVVVKVVDQEEKTAPKPKKAKKKAAKAKDADLDKDIQARIKKAKAEVANKKSAGGTFKRA